jgi:hypothetical protein
MPVSTLPVDGHALKRLFEYIIRGLVTFHWDTHLGAEHIVRVMALTAAGEDHFDGLFALNAANRVRADLGNGTFIYEGAQAVGSPGITVWRIESYGGVQFANSANSGMISSHMGALTGPRNKDEDQNPA